MANTVLATRDGWLLASDGIQWMLCRPDIEHPISFVHSTRDILARCMREKGVPAPVQAELLAGLPPTFEEWKRDHPASLKRGRGS